VGDAFLSFMRKKVLPHQADHPEYIRLDGALRGGNIEVCGTFSHKGHEWVVHADTRFEPLKIAYHALASGTDPFKVENTKHGRCLVLKKRYRAKPNAKYIYIYRASEKSK
jgi:hypothetical protein